jgi:hypothetical protein
MPREGLPGSRLGEGPVTPGGDARQLDSRFPIGPESVRQAFPGRILDYQRDYGAEEDYKTGPASANAVYKSAAAQFSFSYVPPVDCWWEIDFLMGWVEKTDAAYAYSYSVLQLNTNDVDGRASSGLALEYQHSGVQTVAFRRSLATFKLAAGISYVVAPYFYYAAGSWRYFMGSQYMTFIARAIAR